jgi:hypothetical protein
MLLENRFFIAQASLEPSFTSELLTLVNAVDPADIQIVAYRSVRLLIRQLNYYNFSTGTFYKVYPVIVPSGNMVYSKRPSIQGFFTMVFSLSCSAILSWLNMLDPLMVNTSSRVIEFL